MSVSKIFDSIDIDDKKMPGAFWSDRALGLARQLHYAGDTPRSLQPRTEPGLVGSQAAVGKHDYYHHDYNNDHGAGRNGTGTAATAAISLT